MWNGQKCFFVSLMLFVFLNTASTTYARIIIFPSSYKINSSDNRFVFVMIAKGPIEADLKFKSLEQKEMIRSIRSLYSYSGLYRNDSSNEPFWTVDWYSSGAEIASDGIHLVRFRRDAYSIDNEAISFYAKSELLRTYTIRELIDIPILLEYHDNDFNWIEKLDIDDKKLKCTLTTKDGNQFLFNMQTGELISETHSWRWLVGSVLLLMTVMLCGLGWMIERKRKRV